MNRKVLIHFDPTAIIHPEDDAVIKWVNRKPLFRRFLEKTVNRYVAMTSDLNFVGNGYSINEKSSPKLYSRFLEDCEILGIENIPSYSTTWGNFISSLSVGSEIKDRVVVTSGSIDMLAAEELDFIIGHELGHIITGHKPYHTLVEALCDPMFNVGNPIMSAIVKLPLLEWYRLSHYTADRIGLLCCQNINVAISSMIKMAGLPLKYYDQLDVDAFIEQTREFEELHSDRFGTIVRALSIRAANSPWMVIRVKKLLEWYNSQEYRTILTEN